MLVSAAIAPAIELDSVEISIESDPEELPGVTWLEYRVGPHCFILADGGRFWLEDGVTKDAESLRQLVSLLLHPDIAALMCGASATR